MKTSMLRPLWYVPCVLFAFVALVTISSCKEDDREPINDIKITGMSPTSPASLKFYKTDVNDRVLITYDYHISNPKGAKIFVRPRTGGDHSPGFVYSNSVVYKGKGSRTVLISIDEDGNAVNVDQLLIIITNADQTLTLTERFENVDFTFSE